MAAALSAAAALLAVAPPVFAEATHLFDANLSLTGDCSVSARDSVPDPGCPGDTHPPSGPFSNPKGTAVDAYGNRFVASFGNESTGDPFTEGRIDIFNSAGEFIGSLPDVEAPRGIAIDSEGNLYVNEHFRASPEAFVERLRRYTPDIYEPEIGEIEYGNDFATIDEGAPLRAFAMNRLNDHLFIHLGPRIKEYGSAKEGNPLINEAIGSGSLFRAGGHGLAIDAARKRIYAADSFSGGESSVVKVFDLEAPHALIATYDGSTSPQGEFFSQDGVLLLAVDEETGNFFVGDILGARTILEFEADGTYVWTYKRFFEPIPNGSQLAFDNSPKSKTYRYLFVPSRESPPSHSFAFAPKSEPRPPSIDSVSFGGVTEDEARLRAVIKPGGEPATYRFQYTTLEEFEANGFAGAITAGEGTVGPSFEGVPVTAAVAGLAPGTAYRFRLIASNECEPGGCSAEAQGGFTTYRAADSSTGCPNEHLRTGLSAALPDCRAYELVTPSDTNGHPPLAFGLLAEPFTMPGTSAAGNELSFITEGGIIPGFEGTGSLDGDPYLAARTAAGWQTSAVGPDGTEAETLEMGGVSRDQGHRFWVAKTSGSAVVEGKHTSYVRFPDGHSEILGQGSVATDLGADGFFISENGSHIVFTSKVRLESAAPPDGTEAIYDRTPDGTLHVVSLLPEDITPEAKSNARYEGASPDGRGIGFRFVLPTDAATPIYLRRDNAETFLAAPPEAKFAGVAEGGARLFYVHEGDLFAFDAETEEAVRFSEGGDVTVVNVSTDGTAAYFVSPRVPGEEGFGPVEREENPRGELPQPGAHNLYLSEEGAISFVGTVTKRDVEGEFRTSLQTGGLGLWVRSIGRSDHRPGSLARVPARTTSDGTVLLFESRAGLTDYDSKGYAQVYRYDVESEVLDCLSCNPTQIQPTGDAKLQSVREVKGDAAPVGWFNVVSNLALDGDRAFFESPDPLVLADTDGVLDVYEWEAEGVGSCRTPGGCTYLISSGRSARDNHLFAVSEGGRDVFFTTSDLLLPAVDSDETPSVFDARVGGGFAPPPSPAGECLGEACQPVVSPPSESTPASAIFQGEGNVSQKRPGCRKGKRRVRRGGRVRCVSVRKQRRRNHAGQRRAKR